MSTITESKHIGVIRNALGKFFDKPFVDTYAQDVETYLSDKAILLEEVAMAQRVKWLQEFSNDLNSALGGDTEPDKQGMADSMRIAWENHSTNKKLAKADLDEAFPQTQQESTERRQPATQPTAHEIPFDDSGSHAPAIDPALPDVAGMHSESPVTVYPDWRGDVLDTVTGIRYAVSFREGGTWEMALRQIKQFRLLAQEGQRFGIVIDQYRPEEKPAKASNGSTEQPAKPKGNAASGDMQSAIIHKIKRIQNKAGDKKGWELIDGDGAVVGKTFSQYDDPKLADMAGKGILELDVDEAKKLATPFVAWYVFDGQYTNFKKYTRA